MFVSYCGNIMLFELLQQIKLYKQSVGLHDIDDNA